MHIMSPGYLLFTSRRGGAYGETDQFSYDPVNLRKISIMADRHPVHRETDKSKKLA